MTVLEKIGQRLVGGFPGPEMSGEFIRLVREYKLSNAILFQHNVKSRAQVKELCGSIQALVREETGHGALITIDQEGGAVSRLPGDAANVPGAMALAATGDPAKAYRAARLAAGELRALGVNFNLAPVADINSNPDNPIIGVRSYGDTPGRVERFAVPAMRGYLDGGVLASAKHFPGHGDTAMDSHLSLPCIDKPLEELEKLELRPFRALIDAGIPAVMSTHILFPQLEPEHIPATMSRRIMTGLLRERLGFRGLIISDCMEMQAIARYYGSPEGTVAAMAAGVDLVFISHTAATMEQAILSVLGAVESGRLSMEEMDTSVERILALKERYCRPPEGEAGTPGAMAEAAALRRDTITLAGGTIPPPGERPFFCGCKNYQAGLVSNALGDSPSFPEFFARRFGGDALTLDKDPDAAAVSAAAEAAQGHSALFVNTYNGHLYPGQLALLDTLGRLGIPMAAVALRNPYDLCHAPAGAAAIAAWDYSQATLEALVPILAGEVKPTGTLPVSLEVRA